MVKVKGGKVEINKFDCFVLWLNELLTDCWLIEGLTWQSCLEHEHVTHIERYICI